MQYFYFAPAGLDSSRVQLPSPTLSLVPRDRLGWAILNLPFQGVVKYIIP
jgi:hypothetical protein